MAESRVSRTTASTSYQRYRTGQLKGELCYTDVRLSATAIAPQMAGIESSELHKLGDRRQLSRNRRPKRTSQLPAVCRRALGRTAPQIGRATLRVLSPEAEIAVIFARSQQPVKHMAFHRSVISTRSNSHRPVKGRENGRRFQHRSGSANSAAICSARTRPFLCQISCRRG